MLIVFEDNLKRRLEKNIRIWVLSITISISLYVWKKTGKLLYRSCKRNNSVVSRKVEKEYDYDAI